MPLIITPNDKSVIIQYNDPQPRMYKLTFAEIERISIKPMSDISPKSKTHPHPYGISIETAADSYFVKGGELLQIRDEANRLAASLGDKPVSE